VAQIGTGAVHFFEAPKSFMQKYPSTLFVGRLGSTSQNQRRTFYSLSQSITGFLILRQEKTAMKLRTSKQLCQRVPEN
jgi:hypothetical protein